MTLVSHGTDSVRSLLWQLHDLAVPVPITDNMRPSTGTQGDNINGGRENKPPDRSKRRRRLLNSGIFQEFQDYFGVSLLCFFCVLLCILWFPRTVAQYFLDHALSCPMRSNVLWPSAQFGQGHRKSHYKVPL